MTVEVYSAICEFTRCCTEASLDYVITGSVSSSLNGIHRTTNDIDVLLSRSIFSTDSILEKLSGLFTVDEEALVAHHKLQRSYSIFHEGSALKFDLFPARTEFDTVQLERAVTVELKSSPYTFKVTTAEDIILSKLIWLSKTGSERQTNDIREVLMVNRDQLDNEYLTAWARKLEVESSLKVLQAEIEAL